MTISPEVIDVHTGEAFPSRETFLGLAAQGNLIPVYRRTLADLETPVSVYIKLKALGEVSFLLESVEGGEQVGRYSFLGVNPSGAIRVKGDQLTLTRDGQETARTLAPGEDPLNVIKAELDRFRVVRVEGLPRFVGGAVGYIGYDVVRHFERLPASASDDLNVPDLLFLLPDTLVIFDHARHQLALLANAQVGDDPNAAYDEAVARISALEAALRQPLQVPIHAADPLDQPMLANVTRDRFEANVEEAREHIAAGDAFQIVLSQRFSRRTSADALSIYRALRALNPSPYMFFFEFGPGPDGVPLSLIGASPEMMVRYEDGIATVRPIAGTRRRGTDEAEDARLREELLKDPKERAEHVMLIDLGRNDLGRVCEYGTVHVATMMTVEFYSHVMHIVSQVQGKVRAGLDCFDLFRATFPAGTLSGAPKIRAMAIIEGLEGTRRGPYGGAVGYFSYDGSMDTCITIRAVLMQGDLLHVQAGAGIVADSDPAREYDETVSKARALDLAIRRAEQGLR
jgi:anthranilate synthase component 1